MTGRISHRAEISEKLAGIRLDQAAAQLFPQYSRARLQAWIKSGQLRVNTELKRPRDKLLPGDKLELDAILEAEEIWEAESQTLDILFEDEALLVLNKPAGLVVHPAAGHRAGTLLNGLLHHCPDLEMLPRAGIVHRLDKDTTGIMVVAKSLEAHNALVKQMQAREISREYEAVVQGVLTGGGTVDAAMGRHPKNRKKRAVVNNGKEAITHYRILKRFRSHTHVRVNLETGRTHQIRVHMAHVKHPLIGDQMYGGRLRLPVGASAELRDELQRFKRQALHARRLELAHPLTGTVVQWEVKPPQDFAQLLQTLTYDSELEAMRDG